MKRILILIAISIALFGCNDRFDNWVINNTDDTLNIAYTIGTSSDIQTTILKPGEKLDNSTADPKALLGKVWVFDGNDTSKRDNSYTVGKWSIEEMEPVSYTVKSLLTSSQTSGSEAMYLTEINGKMGRYYPSDDNRIQITPDTLKDVNVYDENPSFALVDAAGNRKTELNGYPVSLRIDGNTIFIE